MPIDATVTLDDPKDDFKAALNRAVFLPPTPLKGEQQGCSRILRLLSNFDVNPLHYSTALPKIREGVVVG